MASQSIHLGRHQEDACLLFVAKGLHLESVKILQDWTYVESAFSWVDSGRIH